MTLPDGFVELLDGSEAQWEHSGVTVDEYSPFADPGAFTRRRKELIVDRNYGQAYNATDLGPAAIYGRTTDLPVYSGDELANHGFLRVPFRRIPRRVVRSREEIESILTAVRSADANLRILLRGQGREHYVKRSPETTQWLYGENAVLEPSLTTSASRRTPPLEAVLPEWSSLLQVFFANMATAGSPMAADDFNESFGLPLMALALAQHYGLPTSGLDVTNRLDVALFFALMACEKPEGSPSATYSRLTTFSEMPVLYLLAPALDQQFDYERYRKNGFPRGRPDAQAASFIHIGRGNALNACARRVFLALYLDPEGRFDPIPSASMLFPASGQDRFAAFLEKLTPSMPGQLGQVLATHFYFVTQV